MASLMARDSWDLSVIRSNYLGDDQSRKTYFDGAQSGVSLFNVRACMLIFRIGKHMDTSVRLNFIFFKAINWGHCHFLAFREKQSIKLSDLKIQNCEC